MKQFYLHFRIILSLWLVSTFTVLSGFAQNDLAHFTALRSSGPVPEDFIRYSNPALPDDLNNKEKRIEGIKKFEMSSDYHTRQLFQSGKVIFGDPVSVYVNKVADSLLADFPELRSQLRFYICNSDVANAYASDLGIIFINVGLIARLENEAQLAFIMSHEITHYVKKHNISIFNEKEEILRTKKKEKNYNDAGKKAQYKTLAEKLMTINYWSKEFETIADEQGFITYYLHSPYKPEEAVNAFNVLLYSEYPFVRSPFDISVLETENMKVPSNFILTNIFELTPNEDEADSMSTHPNVKKRKACLNNIMDSLGYREGALFVNSEDEFIHARNIARFEVMRQLILSHNYEESLYCGTELLKTFPDNYFLIRCVTTSLYGLSSYKQTGDANDQYSHLSEMKGKMKQVGYLVRKFSKRDWSVIAAQFAWRMHNKFPDDKYLKQLSDTTLYSMVNQNHVDEKWLYNRTFKEVSHEKKLEGPRPKYETDKYGIRTLREDAVDTLFTKFAFVEQFKDTVFSKKLHNLCAEHDSLQKILVSRAGTLKPYSYEEPEKNRMKNRKYIDNIVMINPDVYNVDLRKEVTLEYARTIRNQHDFVMDIKPTANANKLNVDIITMQMADSIGVEAINDVAIIEEYLEERVGQSRDNMLIPFDAEPAQQVMDRYHSNYLGLSEMCSYRVKKPNGENFMYTLVSCLFPVCLPYYVYAWVRPEVYTFYQQSMYDVRTGRTLVNDIVMNRRVMSKKNMHQNFNRFIKQVRSGHQKKRIPYKEILLS